ncbi:MAG: YgjV family protein, partial [Bacilli bacterium]|nr:YgjV family protein [Bacilli bacterium]
INMLLWIAFDLSYGAYTTVLSDFVTVISTLIGMYRFDFKKVKKN